MVGAGQNAPLGKLLKLAWEEGGVRERMFVALIYLAVPIPVVILYVLALNPGSRAQLGYVVGVGVVWGFLIGFFQQAFLRPIYSPGALKQLARLGYGPEAPETYLELARYLETHGVNGHLPSEMAWGLVCWLAFYGILLAGIALALVLEPAIGVGIFVVFVPVALVVCFPLWRTYRRRVTRFYDAMEESGYHVRSRWTQPVESGNLGNSGS